MQSADTDIIRYQGEKYLLRLIPCSLEKRDHCSTCKTKGGHQVYYRDDGAVNGVHKWTSVGASLPPADPNYKPAPRICQREGCENEIPAHFRRSKIYCSDPCRMAASRAKRQA